YSDSTILVIHGVLSDGFTYNKFSGLLNEVTQAEVVTVDSRGHELSSGTLCLYYLQKIQDRLSL
uniref:hypothetical protein n=1 Tax=Alteromonas sp. (strain LOR) TaxID=1537994 RepID=UPI001F1F1AAF